MSEFTLLFPYKKKIVENCFSKWNNDIDFIPFASIQCACIFLTYHRLVLNVCKDLKYKHQHVILFINFIIVNR